MDRTTVWVKSRGATGSGQSVTIHVDPDCEALRRANSVKRTERHKLPADWPECSLCGDRPADSGGVPAGEDPQARRKRLADTDPDELGL